MLTVLKSIYIYNYIFMLCLCLNNSGGQYRMNTRLEAGYFIHDSWFSIINNLKRLTDYLTGFLFL